MKKNGKYAKRGIATKVMLVILCVMLVAGISVGGTLAWLSATSAKVENTFTYGDINIKLEETDTKLDEDTNVNTNLYKMLPGDTITKDPVVTVLAPSEACWLFVKLEKSSNFDTFMTYEMAEGWIALEGVDGVYYREVAAVTADAPFDVIKNDTITVNGNVTKQMLNALTADTLPTLDIISYAVQRDADIEAIDTAAEAWTIATGSATTN